MIHIYFQFWPGGIHKPTENKFSFLSFQAQTLFMDAFLQNNRLDHVSQVMGYHPSYLDDFLKTQSFILRGDGPLPYVYRHYIAIMVSYNIKIKLITTKSCADLNMSRILQVLLNKRLKILLLLPSIS